MLIIFYRRSGKILINPVDTFILGRKIYLAMNDTGSQSWQILAGFYCLVVGSLRRMKSPLHVWQIADVISFLPVRWIRLVGNRHRLFGRKENAMVESMTGGSGSCSNTSSGESVPLVKVNVTVHEDFSTVL
jgi:hypothetical protein